MGKQVDVTGALLAGWTALKDTDQDPENTANVIELYTGRFISKSSYGGSTGQRNREHVWAQSRGGFTTSPGPGTYLHQVRPEDVTVNSTRGNKDFDLGGTAVSGCTGCWTDGNSFEPRDAVKGDVARMLLYMAIRYEGGAQIGDLEVLLQWNAEDPGEHLREAPHRPHPLHLAGQPQPVRRPPRVGDRDLELTAPPGLSTDCPGRVVRHTSPRRAS